MYSNITFYQNVLYYLLRYDNDTPFCFHNTNVPNATIQNCNMILLWRLFTTRNMDNKIDRIPNITICLSTELVVFQNSTSQFNNIDMFCLGHNL